MNEQTPIAPGAAEAAAALALLRDWAARATPEQVAALDPALARLVPGAPLGNHPPLAREYPEGFVADDAYRATLPDLQNGPASLIRGAPCKIGHVGISGFRLPIRFRTREGGEITLESKITGTVSLEAEKKGINMSRIMRSFYRYSARSFSFDVLDEVLDAYCADLESFDARLLMQISYPILRPALRSGLSGYQYYDLWLETTAQAGVRKKILHADYVYSSTCPCSLELSEHARSARGQLATPHSQRSVARVSVELAGRACLWFEDLIDLCRAAVPTETQVMVKREDEQAFAELNAANPIFVEDAVRLFAQALGGDPRVGDYRVVASHQESLHSHDAVALMTHGASFAQPSLDPTLFEGLLKRG